MAFPDQNTGFVLCINAKDCDDLKQRTIYPVIADSAAQKAGFIRVVDESGEDYLYPASCFVPLDIPQSAREAFSKPSEPR